MVCLTTRFVYFDLDWRVSNPFIRFISSPLFNVWIAPSSVLFVGSLEWLELSIWHQYRQQEIVLLLLSSLLLFRHSEMEVSLQYFVLSCSVHGRPDVYSGVVALPSDTLYGVTSMIDYSHKLFEVKRRSQLKPLGLFVAGPDEVAKWAEVSQTLFYYP